MLVGLAPLLLRRRQVATWIVVGAFVLSIGWSTWAETAAATYSNNFSDLFFNGLPKPLGWVDEATGGKPAVYIGQKIADPNGDLVDGVLEPRACAACGASTAPRPGPGRS